MPKKLHTMTPEQIAEWNGFHKVGDPCLVVEDDGRETETRIRSFAWLLESGHPVVLLHGRTGCFSLDRVRMLELHRIS